MDLLVIVGLIMLVGLAIASPTFGQMGSFEALLPTNPDDVTSPEAIVVALYDVISGRADEERDWDRFRSLMTPGARLVPVFVGPDGKVDAREMSVEQYIERVTPQFKQTGFYEREVSNKQERFGNLVHTFSTYASYRSPDDTEPFMRGINSIQLIFKDDRWWVVNLAWQPEQPEITIPDEYLPSGG